MIAEPICVEGVAGGVKEGETSAGREGWRGLACCVAADGSGVYAVPVVPVVSVASGGLEMSALEDCEPREASAVASDSEKSSFI